MRLLSLIRGRKLSRRTSRCRMYWWTTDGSGSTSLNQSPSQTVSGPMISRNRRSLTGVDLAVETTSRRRDVTVHKEALVVAEATITTWYLTWGEEGAEAVTATGTETTGIAEDRNAAGAVAATETEIDEGGVQGVGALDPIEMEDVIDTEKRKGSQADETETGGTEAWTEFSLKLTSCAVTRLLQLECGTLPALGCFHVHSTFLCARRKPLDCCALLPPCAQKPLGSGRSTVYQDGLLGRWFCVWEASSVIAGIPPICTIYSWAITIVTVVSSASSQPVSDPQDLLCLALQDLVDSPFHPSHASALDVTLTLPVLCIRRRQVHQIATYH